MGNSLSSLSTGSALEERGGAEPETDPRLPMPPAYVPVATSKSILQHPHKKDVFGKVGSVAKAPLQDSDPGVLTEELLNLDIFLIVSTLLGRVVPRM
jgi:hypothetical protein